MNTLKFVDPNLLSLTGDQLAALAPYLWVVGGALVAMICAGIRSLPAKATAIAVCLAAIVAATLSASGFLLGNRLMLFGGMMAADGYASFFHVLFLFSAGISILASAKYLDRQGLQYPEYYILVLFSTVGMMLMASTLDLISIFIALEIMSLAVYVLVGFRRNDRRSNEAAMKYFILGAAASAILLYGTAMLYGATGSFVITGIYSAVSANPALQTPAFHLGAWMVIVGFLFKVAAVPFHMWMPDVYEGAPAPITGFMTTGVKAASFAAFVRVFIALGYGRDLAAAMHGRLHLVLWVLAALTMFFGNVIALTQTNLKRMLAYSSIAHTGYLLVGMIGASGADAGYSPVLMYLATYTVMNLGAFGVLTVLAARSDTRLNLHDLAGLSRRHPWLSFALAVFMFSMAGIPPTAGFAAKYYLLYTAVQAHEVPLVVLAVLCSAISVYYYLRVIVFMYMREDEGADRTADPGLTPALAAFAIAMMVALTLQVGVFPGKMIAMTRRVASRF